MQDAWFTNRRSDKFWSGIWSDMTIEQTLMRSLKISGGLSHGRGISDSTLSRWAVTMPTVTVVPQQIFFYSSGKKEIVKFVTMNNPPVGGIQTLL